jgi:hypothetical protein
MTVYKAPELIKNRDKIKIFLAGSIEEGKAENWQDRFCKFLNHENIDVYNPRRDSWDNTWEQSYSNPEFYQQVNWELSGIEKADMVIFYFDPSTKSPITLLELGLCVGMTLSTIKKDIIVICPDGYFRKGNVEIFCDRYSIELYNNIEEFMVEFRKVEYAGD